MKSKKVMIIMLLLVILGMVWTINIKHITRIRQHMTASQGSQVQPDLHFDSLIHPSYEFIPLERDPFNVHVDTAPKKPVMPQLYLQGVVMTAQGALALMELADGQVIILKQGQEYKGVKIRRITAREVTVRFQGKNQTFEINQ